MGTCGVVVTLGLIKAQCLQPLPYSFHECGSDLLVRSLLPLLPIHLHWWGFLCHFQTACSLLPPGSHSPPCVTPPALVCAHLPIASHSPGYRTRMSVGPSPLPFFEPCSVPLRSAQLCGSSSCPGPLCPTQPYCPTCLVPEASCAHHHHFSLPERSSLQCVFPESLNTYPIMAFGNDSFQQCQKVPLSAQHYAAFLLIGPFSFLASIFCCTLIGFIVVIYQHLRKEPQTWRRPLSSGGH